MQSALRHPISICLASAIGMIVYCAALQVIWTQSVNGVFVAVLLAAFNSLRVAEQKAGFSDTEMQGLVENAKPHFAIEQRR